MLIVGGLSATALSGGFFVAGGIEENRGTQMRFEAPRLAHLGMADGYYKNGGWAGGIAVGLIAVAIYLLRTAPGVQASTVVPNRSAMVASLSLSPENAHVVWRW